MRGRNPSYAELFACFRESLKFYRLQDVRSEEQCVQIAHVAMKIAIRAYDEVDIELASQAAIDVIALRSEWVRHYFSPTSRE